MKIIRCADYTISFEDWNGLNNFVTKSYSRVVVLVDNNTERDCLPIFKSHVKFSFEKISITAGEAFKNIDTCCDIWKKLLAAGADRKTLLINLGGGVIGDMGGFAASSYMRGIDFIQLPTTLLSMVDASIGGKLGIDFESIKNLIGLFQNPKSIFIFPIFLNTLLERELKSGMAEMYKHGLIADKAYWKEVCEVDKNYEDWRALIYRSIEIKNKIVEKDPKEAGVRKVLNFGHTIGHAIESLNLNTSSHLLHGEAIILGMIAESYISYKKGMLSIIQLEDILNGFDKKYNFLESINLEEEQIIALCYKDKKNQDRKILGSLLNGLGSCSFNVEVTEEEVSEALDFLEKYLKK